MNWQTSITGHPGFVGVINLPDGRRTFNPTHARVGRGVVLAWRNERADGRARINLARGRSLAELVRRPPRRWVELDLGDAWAADDIWHEDPRLLALPDGRLVLWLAIVRRGVRRGWCAAQARIEIDPATLEPAGPLWMPRIGFNLHSTEKNWTPFVSGGREFIYYDFTTGAWAEIVPGADTPAAVPGSLSYDGAPPLPWPHGTLSGGTQAVPFAPGLQVALYHGFRHIYQNKQYFMGAITFEDCPPFRRHSVGPPIVTASAEDPIVQCPWAAEYAPLVIFPGGLHHAGDELWTTCGLHDSRAIVLRLAAADLGLVPVAELPEVPEPLAGKVTLSDPVPPTMIRVAARRHLVEAGHHYAPGDLFLVKPDRAYALGDLITVNYPTAKGA